MLSFRLFKSDVARKRIFRPRDQILRVSLNYYCVKRFPMTYRQGCATWYRMLVSLCLYI